MDPTQSPEAERKNRILKALAVLIVLAILAALWFMFFGQKAPAVRTSSPSEAEIKSQIQAEYQGVRPTSYQESTATMNEMRSVRGDSSANQQIMQSMHI